MATLDGGAPVKIGTIDSSGAAVQVSGTVVLNWTSINQTTGAATLSAWTSASATAANLSTASQAPSGFEAASVSADGTLVAFLTNLSADGNTADLAVATIGSTSAPATVVSGINIGDLSCFPSFAFAGSTLVAVYPPSVGDAGAPDASAGKGDAGGAADGGGADGAAPQYVATATAYAGSTWTPTLIANDALCAIAVDPSGAQVLVSTSAGLAAHAVAAPTTPTLLDAKGVWGEFAAGADGGLDVVYTDRTSELKRVSAAGTGTPLVLVASGLSAVAALSPDSNWALATNLSQTTMTGVTTDLYLASATKAGAATTLVATPTAAPVGDWFTVDSTHALYGAGVTSDAGVPTSGFYVAATSGGAPSQLSTNVGFAFATSGGKIVFNANDDQGGYDLFAADTTQSAPPTLLVSVADEAFFLTAAKDMIVYTWSFTGDATDGLYVMPVP